MDSLTHLIVGVTTDHKFANGEWYNFKSADFLTKHGVYIKAEAVNDMFVECDCKEEINYYQDDFVHPINDISLKKYSIRDRKWVEGVTINDISDIKSIVNIQFEIISSEEKHTQVKSVDKFLFIYHTDNGDVSIDIPKDELHGLTIDEDGYGFVP